MFVLSWALLLLWIYITNQPTQANSKQTFEGKENVNEPPNSRKSYSAVIQEFSLSLYADTDPNRFHLNVNKSHMTSVTRDVQDTRPSQCAAVQYEIASLPVASIVIPLHNEPWSTLERLINSILKRSPPQLLKEIIIIDDMSDLDHLGDPLNRYAEQFDVLKIHRALERLGTMKARVLGTQLAKGDVVVFLDSHTEVNVGWLEPLLHEISKHNTAIVQPSIDVVDPDTFQYRQYFKNNLRGHFKWSMGFEYVPLTVKQKAEVVAEPTKAFNTPAIVGCAFAVNRKYFQDIGGLDTGMRTWGGEDVELSVRVWLCGGSMKISPCSHVAHIHKSAHPFKMDYSDLVYNNRRTAEMWLGNYRKYFYYFNAGFAKPPGPSETFSEMDEIKKKFKCKDFDWLLKNVYTELEIPPEGSEYFGHLRNLGSGFCFGPSDSSVVGSFPIITQGDCFIYYKVRNFALLKNGLLMVDGKCVYIEQNFLVISPCSKGISKWSFKGKQLVYKDIFGSKCAVQVPKVVDSTEKQVAMMIPCDSSNRAAEWEITNKLYKVDI
ncbi:inactive polypeptide N-acetylgalactosaminyltransferase-like protein 5 [Mizuhopecten yessoensis]|nr:inactive polypeptide N-acetylgalactosaminyltransferase-like protein 5 [Mizuhopecten yessoensis]